jgi:hypothetical protein
LNPEPGVSGNRSADDDKSLFHHGVSRALRIQEQHKIRNIQAGSRLALASANEHAGVAKK